MNLRPITLSAAGTGWRLFSIRRSDPKFSNFQQRVLARDHHTCQYCGFKAKRFMEVVNIDGNYRHNHIDNLATACPFCAQCFFLESIGKGDFGAGTLVYLPEMSQNELNALCHVLFSMMITGGRSCIDAKNIYRNMRLRSQYVEKELGKGLSTPSVYGQLLIDASIENKDEMHKVLMNKLRVLPTMTAYVGRLEAWALDALTDMS